MMTLLEQIIEDLKNRPQIRYEQTARAIKVSANDVNGFDVVCRDDTPEGGDFSVQGLFWHDEFDNTQEAYSCFMSCLTPQSRLEITSRGGKDYRATLQMLQGDEWVPVSTVSLAFYPFWLKKEIRYLHNHLI
jgi:hypothetical protein